MSKNLPSALNRGDTIAVIAPASPFSREQFRTGCAVLESAGFTVQYRDDIFATERYLAGTQDRRLTELVDALHDDSIKAVFCARGGYGTAQLLKTLDLSTLTPKIVVGYSDITSLHCALAQHGWPSFYGPTICRHLEPSAPSANLEWLLRTLQPQALGKLPMDGVRMIKPGSATGVLRGGCLSLLQTSIGTAFALDTQNAILFIEETEEKIYQLERMLRHLLDAGLLHNVQGIVFGSMNLPASEKHPDWLEPMLRDVLQDFAGPVLTGFPAGHCDPFITLPLGCHATLSTDPLSFSIIEAAVQP